MKLTRERRDRRRWKDANDDDQHRTDGLFQTCGQKTEQLAGCHSIVLLIVLESEINKRLVFFSSAVRSEIITAVT